jgi:cold shock CspA family protein
MDCRIRSRWVHFATLVYFQMIIEITNPTRRFSTFEELRSFIMNSSNQRGVVREFDTVRGRGIIQSESGEYFPVRYSAIAGTGIRKLGSGDRVIFEVEQNQSGFSAIHVMRT